MKKSYFTSFSTPSHWKSCETISGQLMKTYSDSEAWFQDKGQALPEDLNHLIILDHRWVKEENLGALKASQNISVDFFLFGDFTLKIVLFKKHWEALKHLNLKIIVASLAQRDLVGLIFPEIKDLIELRDYPVEENLFSFSKDLREKKRKEMSGVMGRVILLLVMQEEFLRRKVFLN